MLSKHFTTSALISLSTCPHLWTSKKKVIGPVGLSQKRILKNNISFLGKGFAPRSQRFVNMKPGQQAPINGSKRGFIWISTERRGSTGGIES